MNLKSFICGLFSLVLLAIPANAQIQAGKAINIMIQNVPDQDKGTINGLYPVSDSGNISVPFINQIRAAGYSHDQLARIRECRFKSAGIYRNPTIQVMENAEATSVNQEVVTVGGQVRRPGPVPYTRELTLWQAVQAAGGATEFGSMKRVRLTRNGKQKSYDATKSQFMQIPLQRNDTIEVPQKTPWGG